MSGLNLGVSSGMVISAAAASRHWAASMMFVPLNLAAYAFIPKEQTNNASGLFALVRNEGSSIGVALSNTLLQRRTQFHQSRMIEHISPFNPVSSQWLSGIAGRFQGFASDPVAAQRRGLGTMYRVVQQQAAAVSYLDLFWLFAMLSFAVIPLVLFMKRAKSDALSMAAH